MKVTILEVYEHLEAMTNEINQLMKRNNMLMLNCGTEEEALPYLSTHFDLISMRAANNAYIDMFPITKQKRPIKEVIPRGHIML